ncbi:MAG: retroviral-like aspartic protease family protein [Acetobacter sp.]|uniref:retroviral-like aspartic protease family protein n=1 Tax=Acetobacter sp. TaxID=440 RepID=UPI0039EC0C0B
MKRTFCLIVLLIPLAGCARSIPSYSCPNSSFEELPFLPDTEFPVVQVRLNGHAAAMLVDTGAGRSVITPQAAEEFGLSETGQSLTMHAVGSDVATPIVRVVTLQLGHLKAVEPTFLLAAIPVRSVGGLPVAGLFGADFLSGYDVLFDLPHHRMVLISGNACIPNNVPPADRMAFPAARVLLPIRLDDRPLMAVLDSGSNRTTIPVSLAGVQDALLEKDENVGTRGPDGQHLDAWLHRFGAIQIGTSINRDIELAIAPIRTPYALLGADFLRHRIVLISYRRGMAYLLAENPIAP